jgi:predicted CoA-binding protein
VGDPDRVDGWDERDPRRVLAEASTIAVVGLDSDPMRPSNSVSAYMQRQGYRIVPVNPNETEVLGEQAYPSLHEVPVPVDIVNVFRRPGFTPPVAQDTLAIGGVKMLWLQQGIMHPETRRIAEEGGLVYVEDACIRTIHSIWIRGRSQQ